MRISDWSSDVCSSDLLDPTLLDNRIDGRRTSDGEKSRAHATANVLTLNWQTGGYTLRSTTAYTTALADDDAINPALLGARIITGHKIGRASCRERVCKYV